MPPQRRAAFRYRTWAKAIRREDLAGIHYLTDFAHAYAKHYSSAILGEHRSNHVRLLADRYVKSILGKDNFTHTSSEGRLQTIRIYSRDDPELVPQFVTCSCFTRTNIRSISDASGN